MTTNVNNNPILQNPQIEQLDKGALEVEKNKQIETKESGQTGTIDTSKLENIINSTEPEKIPSSKTELEQANKLTHSIETKPTITDISGKEPKILQVDDLPQATQELLDKSIDLRIQYHAAESVKEKLSLLTSIRTTLEGLTQALQEIDPKSKSEALETDQLSESIFVLVDMEEAVDALHMLREESALLRNILEGMKTELTDPKAYAELHESIGQCEGLDPKDRNELLNSVNTALKSVIEAELKADPSVHQILAKSEHVPPESEVISAAASILARIRIETPYMQDKIGFSELLHCFANSRTPNELPIIKGATEEDRLVAGFAEGLIVLAAVSDPANEADALTFCHFVDRFAGHRLDHFGPMGMLLKSALAPTPRIRTIALAHQEFEVSLKTLLSKLPKKTLAKFDSLQSVQTLSSKGIDALKQLPNFQDISYHLAYLLLLQAELVRNGALELHKVVDGDPAYEGFDVRNLDPIALRNISEKIAFEQIARFAKEVDDYDVDRIVNFCAREPLFKQGSESELSPMHQKLIGELQYMRENYVKRSLEGDKDEAEIANTLQKTANKLTGTYFSQNYLTKLYDLNLGTKSARVYDGLMRELTGVLDPVKRNMLKPTDRDIVSELAFEAERTLLNAIEEDPSKLLKNKELRKEGEETLQNLLFDRAAAEKKGFDFKNLDKKTKEILKEQSNAYAAIEGTRRRVIESLKHEEDFAIRNGQAVRLHMRKKKINATVKTHRANAAKVFTCFWHWKDREANVGKILQLSNLKKSLESLDLAMKSGTQPGNPELRKTLEGDIQKLFGELKDLNLSNLAKHDCKEERSLDDFLKEAVPLAKAIDYMRISKRVKDDLATIKDLKKQRKEARKLAEGYLNEAKKAYGEEVILQIQRTAVMAAYLVDKDHGSEPMTARERLRFTQEFLKKNIPAMKHCDEGILDLIVREAMRRYTPPIGPMTGKYLDRIDKELGSGGSDSLRVKTEEGNVTAYDIKDYKTSATLLYNERGVEGLMEMVSDPGQGFIYSKKTSFTVSSMPALMEASLSYMPSNSFSVTNTGNGFRVIVKSDHAAKLAASAGFKLTHAGVAPDIGAVTIQAKAELGGSKGRGLELKFSSAKDAENFIKDFMDPASDLHKGEPYNPSWHVSEDIKFLTEKTLSGGFDVTAKAMLRTYIGNDTYSNHLHLGSNQDFTKVTNIGEYFATLDPTNSGNKFSNIQVKLPSMKVGFGVTGGLKKTTATNRNTTIERSSRRLRISAELEATQFQVTHTFKPLYKALWGGVGKAFVGLGGEKLADMLLTAFAKAGLEGEKAKLVQDRLDKALQAAKKGELDDANTQLSGALEYLGGPVLDEFIKLDTNNKHLKNFQNLAKILSFETKANHIGIFKAGTDKTGMFTDHANIKAGVNLKVGPMGLVGQAVGNVFANSGADDALNTYKDAKGLPSDTPESKEKGFFDDAAPHLATAGKTFGVIHNILMGDPTLAAASIISSVVGERSMEEKTQHHQIKVGVNGKDLVKAEVHGRSEHLEGNFESGLRTGIKMSGAINVFGTCDTEHVDVYDHVQHQHLAETGIDYKITKSKFSLENLLEMLHLPQPVIDDLNKNETLMKAIMQAFVYSGPEDTFTLKTRIKSSALAEVQRLELQSSLKPESARELKKEIEALLGNPENYTPVSISVTHNDVRALKLAFEMSEIDLGVFSFSHKREITNINSTTIPLTGLASVQSSFVSTPVKDAFSIENLAPQTTGTQPNVQSGKQTESARTEGKDVPKTEGQVESNKDTSKTEGQVESGKNDPKTGEKRSTDANTTVETSKKSTDTVPAAMPKAPSTLEDPKSHAAEWRNYANGVRSFIEANRTTFFKGEQEALNRLLAKVSVNSDGVPESFLKDLAKAKSAEHAAQILITEFREVSQAAVNDQLFAATKKSGLQRFQEYPIPTSLNQDLGSHELEDYKAKVVALINDRDVYNTYRKEELDVKNKPTGFLAWITAKAASKIISDRTLTAVKPGAAKPTTVYPSAQNPVEVGQVFSQNDNTCFMMSVANALSATEKGTKLLNDWLKTNPPIDPKFATKPDFDTFERQVATLYAPVIAVNNTMHWNGLGEMGEADAVALGFNLLDAGGAQFDGKTPEWRQREFWADTTRALAEERIALLYTLNPRHYRAIVGTYGDPKTGDFGFILRDSNRLGTPDSPKEYPMSAKEFFAIEGQRRVNFHALPDVQGNLKPEAPNAPLNPEASSGSKETQAPQGPKKGPDSTTVDISKKSTDAVPAAMPQAPSTLEEPKKHANEWRTYADGVVRFIDANRTTFFKGEQEALNRLLAKVSVNSEGVPDAFLKDLAKAKSAEHAAQILIAKFGELRQEAADDQLFAYTKKSALQRFENYPIPTSLNQDTGTHELEDYKAKVVALINDRSTYNTYRNTELDVKEKPTGFLAWITAKAASKIVADRALSAVNPGKGTKANQYPSASNPVKVGQFFGQHTNTCFMMSVVNALCATERGVRFLNDWLKTNPPVDPNLADAHFDRLEEQLATLYKPTIAENNTMHWNGLGEMGEADAVGLALGFTNAGGALLEEGVKIPAWRQREIWAETTRALSEEKVAFLYTTAPRHYRAIVGTYGDPKTDNFGFIIRDSSHHGTPDEYRMSMSELVNQRGHRNIIFQTIPEGTGKPGPNAPTDPKAPNGPTNPTGPKSTQGSDAKDANQVTQKTDDVGLAPKSVFLEDPAAVRKEIAANHAKALNAVVGKFGGAVKDMLLAMLSESMARTPAEKKTLSEEMLLKNAEAVAKLQANLTSRIAPKVEAILNAKTEWNDAQRARFDEAVRLASGDMALIAADEAALERFLFIATSYAEHPILNAEDFCRMEHAVQRAVSMHPEFVDPASEDFTELVRHLFWAVENRNGAGDYFRTASASEKDQILEILACFYAGRSDGYTQNFLLCILPELQKKAGFNPIDFETYRSTAFPNLPKRSYQNAEEMRRDLANAFTDRFTEEIVSRTHCDYANKQTLPMQMILMLDAGIPYPIALEKVINRYLGKETEPLDLSKTRFIPNLVFGTDFIEDTDGSKTEQCWFTDAKRMGKTDPQGVLHNSEIVVTDAEGKKSTFTAGVGEKHTASIQALPVELKRLCDGHLQQYKLILKALTQASPVQNACRMLSAADDIKIDEHMPLNVEIEQRDNGDIHLSLDLPEGYGVRIGASYIVHPDGTSTTERFDLRRGDESKEAEKPKVPTEELPAPEKTEGKAPKKTQDEAPKREGEALAPYLQIAKDIKSKYDELIWAFLEDEYQQLLSTAKDPDTFRTTLQNRGESILKEIKKSHRVFTDIRGTHPKWIALESVNLLAVFDRAMSVDHTFIDPKSDAFQNGMRILEALYENKNEAGHVFWNLLDGRKEDFLQVLLCFGRADAMTRTDLTEVASKLPRMRELQPEGPITAETFLGVMFGDPVPQSLLEAKEDGLQSEVVRKLSEARDVRLGQQGLAKPSERQETARNLARFCALDLPYETAFDLAVKFAKAPKALAPEVQQLREDRLEQYQEIWNTVRKRLQVQQDALGKFIDWVENDPEVLDQGILNIENAMDLFDTYKDLLTKDLADEDRRNIPDAINTVDQFGEFVTTEWETEDPALRQKITGMYARLFSIQLAEAHSDVKVTVEQLLALRDAIEEGEHANAKLFLDALEEYAAIGDTLQEGDGFDN